MVIVLLGIPIETTFNSRKEISIDNDNNVFSIGVFVGIIKDFKEDEF